MDQVNESGWDRGSCVDGRQSGKNTVRQAVEDPRNLFGLGSPLPHRLCPYSRISVDNQVEVGVGKRAVLERCDLHLICIKSFYVGAGIRLGGVDANGAAPGNRCRGHKAVVHLKTEVDDVITHSDFVERETARGEALAGRQCGIKAAKNFENLIYGVRLNQYNENWLRATRFSSASGARTSISTPTTVSIRRCANSGRR